MLKMSSNSCNSLYLSLALTASVTSVLLVIVVLTSPKNITESINFSPNSYSTFDSSEEANLLTDSSNSALLNDAPYLESPDALLKSTESHVSSNTKLNYNSERSNKNTVYTNDNSLPVAK